MRHPSKHRRIITPHLMALLALVATTAAQAAPRVVTVCSDPWAPWVLGEEGGKATGGIGVKLTEELFRRLGVDSDIGIFPYARCLAQMKSGERDLLLLAKKTPEREKYMLYSELAATDPQQFYFAPGQHNQFDWQHGPDLTGLVIGGVRGFSYGDLIEQADTYGFTVELVGNDLQNIKKLLAGRIDLAILNRSTAQHFTRQHPEWSGRFKAAPKNLTDSKFYFALSKRGNATDLIDNINGALSAMKQDGTHDKILQNSP